MYVTSKPFTIIIIIIINDIGCPKKVRVDYGTENCSVAKLQIAWHLLFEENSEAIKSVIYGPSTANIVWNNYATVRARSVR